MLVYIRVVSLASIFFVVSMISLMVGKKISEKDWRYGFIGPPAETYGREGGSRWC